MARDGTALSSISGSFRVLGCLLATACAVTGCGGGAGADGSGAGTRVGVVPATATQVVRLDLRDASWSRARRVLLRVPAWSLAADRLPHDLRAEIFHQLEARAGFAGRLPVGASDAGDQWRGNWGGYARLASGDEIVWVDVTDAGKARAIAKHALGDHGAGSYRGNAMHQGAALHRGTGSSSHVCWATVGPQLVEASSKRALTDTIDANLGTPLERTNHWHRLLGATPTWSMLQAWVKPGAAVPRADVIAANVGVAESGVRVDGKVAVTGIDARMIPVVTQRSASADDWASVVVPARWNGLAHDLLDVALSGYRTAAGDRYDISMSGLTLPLQITPRDNSDQIDISSPNIAPDEGRSFSQGIVMRAPGSFDHVIVWGNLFPAVLAQQLLADRSQQIQQLGVAQAQHVTAADFTATATGMHEISFSGRIDLAE